MSRYDSIHKNGIALGCWRRTLNKYIKTDENAVPLVLAIMVYLWGEFDQLRSELVYHLEIGSLDGHKKYYKWRRVA
jgi:hypothetical protein